MPSREGASNTPAVTVGGGAAELVDFKIDESRSTYKVFTVTIDRKASNNTSSNNVVDATVQLLKNGTATGSNLAATSTKWPTSDGTATYGGSTNLWGTTWTGANVNTIVGEPGRRPIA